MSPSRGKNLPRSNHRPEVEATWERLANLTPTVLSTGEPIALGKGHSKITRYPLSFGVGPEAHIGELDITHQFRDTNFEFLRWQEEHGVLRRGTQTIRAPMPTEFLRLGSKRKGGDHSHPNGESD